LGRWLQFNIGHEQKVDDIRRIIRLNNKNRPAAGHRHDELRMLYGDLPPIGQVQDKGLKRLGSVNRLQLLDSHDQSFKIDAPATCAEFYSFPQPLSIPCRTRGLAAEKKSPPSAVNKQFS
jgi:hypothetical protein